MRYTSIFSSSDEKALMSLITTESSVLIDKPSCFSPILAQASGEDDYDEDDEDDDFEDDDFDEDLEEDAEEDEEDDFNLDEDFSDPAFDDDDDDEEYYDDDSSYN